MNWQKRLVKSPTLFIALLLKRLGSKLIDLNDVSPTHLHLFQSSCLNFISERFFNFSIPELRIIICRHEMTLSTKGIHQQEAKMIVKENLKRMIH